MKFCGAFDDKKKIIGSLNPVQSSLLNLEGNKPYQRNKVKLRIGWQQNMKFKACFMHYER